MNLRNTLFCLAVIGLCACQSTPPQEAICIDFDRIEPVDITQGEVIPLETIEASLLSSVDRLIVTEERFFIQSRQDVIAFDRSGRYLFTVGRQGRGPGEYLWAQLFTEGDTLSIYDWQSRQVLDYDLDGFYLSSRLTEPADPESSGGVRPNSLFPLSSGGYLAQNTYQGVPLATPRFSLLNDRFEVVYPMQGLTMEDGMTYNDLLLSDQNTLLYNRLFYDTLYRVSPQMPRVERAYYVDFGAHKLSEGAKVGKDYVDLIQESNTPAFVNTIASLIRYSRETSEKVQFIFAFRSGIHYVVYDRKAKTAKTFRLTDPENRLKLAPFIAYTTDAIYLSATQADDENANPVLIRMPNQLFE
jgi:hypothetical protein